jgi:hypothetical protein
MAIGVGFKVGNFLFEIISHLFNYIFFDLSYPLSGYAIFVPNLLKRNRRVGKNAFVENLQFPVGHLGSELGNFLVEQR